MLYLDDLAPGHRFASTTFDLTREELLAFAGRYDPQPFHLDEEAGVASPFGGLVASGWQTAAITMRLLVDSLPIAGGLIGAGGEVSWPRPVRAGDRLSVTSEILAVRPSGSKPDRGTVTARCETLNQHGQVVQVMQPRLVVPRRPAAHQGTTGAPCPASP